MMWVLLARLARSEEDVLSKQPWQGSPCIQFGQCRPSFLIIGVGKCGTSSLYYYLNGHPSVKQAAQKQIQWFDHQYSSRFDGYLRNFPKWLEPGEMTGEASPGYVQYAGVPTRVFRHLPEVRILVIARDPAERAYSSYHYNYLTIAHRPLPFHVLVDAEIELLRKCLAVEGPVDLSASCYGKTTVEQQLKTGSPHPKSNQHLWRQLVGRSLYAVYLDWWPEGFCLVCSELLGDIRTAADEMHRVASHLGLPPFDFQPVVAKGKYNAGAQHRGYSHLTAWDQASDQTRPPMSDAARTRIADFADVYNRRLFDRAGRICPYWGLNATPTRRLKTSAPTGYLSSFL